MDTKILIFIFLQIQVMGRSLYPNFYICFPNAVSYAFQTNLCSKFQPNLLVSLYTNAFDTVQTGIWQEVTRAVQVQ
jgi:hypothetical protein